MEEEKSRLIITWNISQNQIDVLLGKAFDRPKDDSLWGLFSSLKPIGSTCWSGRVAEEHDLEQTKKLLASANIPVIDLENRWTILELSGPRVVDAIQASFPFETLMRLFIRENGTETARDASGASPDGNPSMVPPKSDFKTFHVVAIYNYEENFAENLIETLKTKHKWIVSNVRNNQPFDSFLPPDMKEALGIDSITLTVKEQELVLLNSLLTRQIRARAAAPPKHPERSYNKDYMLRVRAEMKDIDNHNLHDQIKLQPRPSSQMNQTAARPSFHYSRSFGTNPHIPTEEEIKKVAEQALEDAKKREANKQPGILDNLFGVKSFVQLADSLNPSAPEFVPNLEGMSSKSSEALDVLTLTQSRIIKLLKHAGPSGVKLSNLEKEYKRRFALDLDIESVGFSTMEDLIHTLSPAVAIEYIEDSNAPSMSEELVHVRQQLGLPLAADPLPVVKLYQKVLPAEHRFFQLLILFLIADVTHYDPVDPAESSKPELGVRLGSIPVEWQRKYGNTFDLDVFMAHCNVNDLASFVELIPELQVIKSVKDLRIRVIPETKLPPAPLSILQQGKKSDSAVSPARRSFSQIKQYPSRGSVPAMPMKQPSTYSPTSPIKKPVVSTGDQFVSGVFLHDPQHGIPPGSPPLTAIYAFPSGLRR